ncbi:MAG TPA: trans-aconitate 2-methyltransferase [Mycobacteriales bacterium]|nr:trans-aconitate 2-methyltransferase [Mycobacteriales bacterium]
MPAWDPTQYARYSDERSRPFFDLTDRIHSLQPSYVVDLGCGSGELTATLADRWPGARVDGVDSSPAMLEKAAPFADRVRFSQGDIPTWTPDSPIDVLVSNAALQWVDGHIQLLPRFIDFLSSDGILAFQVPGNFEFPSHVLLRDLRRSSRWKALLGEDAVRLGSHEPAEYLDVLAGAGCQVDIWETTYLHVLQGPDAVLEWVKGTALRPVLSLLDEGQSAEFLAEYGAALRQEYPQRDYGTVFPFRRIFAIARRSA